LTQFDPLDPTDRQNFQISKIRDGGGRHSEKLKISIFQQWFIDRHGVSHGDLD